VRRWLILAVIGALPSAGCISRARHAEALDALSSDRDAVATARDAAVAALTATKGDLALCEADLVELGAALATAEAEAADVRDALATVDALRAALAEAQRVATVVAGALRAQLAPDAAALPPLITVRTDGAEVRVALPTDTLFPPGATRLGRDGDALLTAVVAAFRDVPPPSGGLGVEVHTDDRAVATDRHPSARHLAADRAIAVVEVLLAAGLAPPEAVSAVSYGGDRPVDGNQTPEGRAANRRVEIVWWQEAVAPPPERPAPPTEDGPLQPSSPSLPEP
jgi:chemotaxis protein MotB